VNRKDALLPFMETDIEAVGGLRDRQIQLAMSSGALHQDYARPHTLVTSNTIAIYLEYKLKVQMTVLHNDKDVMEKALVSDRL
jgi:hypothetical protein